MSGWVKAEKDLQTDPRVIKIASKICNADALHAVTLVLGGLVRLWMLADTHVGNDNILSLGTDHINKLLGIQGFCEVLPPDWLEVLDSDHVKLPDFHAHNSTAAKKKDQGTKRVQRYRMRVNATALQPLHTGNGRALPDLDLDQDLDQKKSGVVFDSRSVPGLDQSAWSEWLAYRADRKPAIKPRSMPLAAKQMAALGAGQRAAVEYSRANDYQGLIEKPRTNGANGKAPPAAADNTAAWAEASTRAQAIGFRAPFQHESPGAYMRDVAAAEYVRPTRTLDELRARAAQRKPQP